MDLKVGRFYWVTGQGPMKLHRIPERVGDTYTFRNARGFVYWASRNYIGSESSEDEARLFVERSRERGVYSANFVPNWNEPTDASMA